MTTPLLSSDLSLASSLSALVTHLVSPLTLTLASPQLLRLRQAITASLTVLYAPTWVEGEPWRGSGFRSLVAVPGRLPRPLRDAASACGVSLAEWENALGGGLEWQCWCDPGRVQWREGGWEWEDGVFFLGGWKDTTRTLWTAPSLSIATLPRPSHAVTIRPPAAIAAAVTLSPPPFLSPVLASSPTGSSGSAALPPLSDRPDSPSGSDISSSTFTSSSTAPSVASSSHPVIFSASSNSVSPSPTDRLRSASPAKKISVTAYDGGKVGVLGGGVKLGGGPPPTAPGSPKRHARSYTAQSSSSTAMVGTESGRGRTRTSTAQRGPGLFYFQHAQAPMIASPYLYRA